MCGKSLCSGVVFSGHLRANLLVLCIPFCFVAGCSKQWDPVPPWRWTVGGAFTVVIHLTESRAHSLSLFRPIQQETGGVEMPDVTSLTMKEEWVDQNGNQVR